MRRLWHRLLTVPSQTRCIYCKTIWGKGPGLQPFLLRRPYTTLFNTMQPSTEQCRNSDTIQKPNKASLLADFYRSLSTQDIDRIWPLYTFLYNNHLLSTLTRRNYHHLFVYTIHSRPCQKNLHRLSALVDDMKEQGYQLKLSEYNALIDWVGGKTVPHIHPHHLTDALQLFEEMQQADISPSVVTFNILIHIAAELSDMRTGQKLYHDMISRGLKPDIYTYSTLLFAMGKTGDVHGIDHMLREIKENGLGHLANSNIVWNTTMSGYACNGLRDKGYRMFEQMMKALKEKRVKNNSKKKKKSNKREAIPAADAESFRIYMDMLIYDNKRDEAIQSLEIMKKNGVKPSITIFNTLFNSFLKKPHEWVEEGELALLEKLYLTMKEDEEKIKLKPNSETMYTLVSAFLDLGDTKSALESFVYLSNLIEKNNVITVKDIQSHSVASLSEERYKSIKDPTRIEPSQELLDRLNQVVSKSVI